MPVRAFDLSENSPKPIDQLDYDELISLIEDTKDESNLSGTDLQRRKDAYERLTKTTTKKVLDINVIKSNVAPLLQKVILSSGLQEIKEDAFNKTLDYVAGKLQNNETPDPNVIGDTYASAFPETTDYLKGDIFEPRRREIKGGFNPFFTQSIKELSAKELLPAIRELRGNRSIFLNYVDQSVPGQDYAGDIERLNPLIADRKYLEEQDKNVTDLQNEIPTLLEKNRNELYGQQRQFAKDFITNEYAPQVLQQLNRRGLASSGQVGATIGGKYNELMNSIDTNQLDQQNEEVNFWANQAYQNTLSQLIQSRLDTSNVLQNSRQDTLTQSSNNFAKRQADIQSKFNLDLFRSENERALSEYQKQAQRQTDLARNQNQANLIGEIGQVGGQILTSYIANKSFGSNSSGSQTLG